MFPAPLAFLRTREPPRTRTAHLNPVSLYDTQNRLFDYEFHIPSPSGQLTRQTFPLKKVGSSLEPSFYVPPAHYHLLQDEHFHVVSGSGVWHLWGGKDINLKAGDDIVVPRWKWHTFEITPDSTELLAVVYRYEKEYAEMEEKFFRNVLSYMGDCQKHGVQPSIFQVLVFSMHNWMPISMGVKGPEWLDLLVSLVFMVVAGTLGKFLMGYEATYPEYYEEKPKVK